MEYNMPCGCIVKVTEDTLDATVEYCPAHSPNKAITDVGKQITEIVEAADHLADTFRININTMVTEGSRIVRMLKALKGEKEDDEQEDEPTGNP